MNPSLNYILVTDTTRLTRMKTTVHLSPVPPRRPAMVKPRFTIDVQTFTNLLLLVVPGGAVYFWTRGDQLDEEAMEEKMTKEHARTTIAARKGSAALAPIFRQRRQDGSFDAEMEQKLDDLLRAGSKTRVRVNTDNAEFHDADGSGGGIVRGVQYQSVFADRGGGGGGSSGSGSAAKDMSAEKADWRAGLTGAEIIKEKKRRRKVEKRRLRKMEKLRAAGHPSALTDDELLTELTAIRARPDGNLGELRSRKANLKAELKAREVPYK